LGRRWRTAAGEGDPQFAREEAGRGYPRFVQDEEVVEPGVPEVAGLGAAGEPDPVGEVGRGGELDAVGGPDAPGGLGSAPGPGEVVGPGDAVGAGVAVGEGDAVPAGLGEVVMALAPLWCAGIQTELLVNAKAGSTTRYRRPALALAGTVNTTRCPVPRGRPATLVQVPAILSMRSTAAPGLLNGATTCSRSVVLPGTSQNVNGASTVTVTEALCAPSGPSSRKTSAAVGTSTENLTPPRRPVTPLAACCHPDVPCVRSSKRTGSPADG